jgi:(2R)-sulfolactate sulfo-lyase subunit alpha
MLNDLRAIRSADGISVPRRADASGAANSRLLADGHTQGTVTRLDLPFLIRKEAVVTDKNPKIQFLVHDAADTVGVATADLKAGESVRGLYMDTKEAIEIKAVEDIPLGHKIALRQHPIGSSVIKYEHDIGMVIADIKRGQHVHVHNLKTRRW